MVEPNPPERVLIFLLRFGGGLMLLAVLAMFMPVEWMAATHRWLGLGPFPASPLVEYLTRSISALYGIHGGLLLVIARRVRRHRAISFYLATMNIVFGVALVIIDMNAGLPMLWTISEGPPLLAFGLLEIYLLRSVPAESPEG